MLGKSLTTLMRLLAKFANAASLDNPVTAHHQLNESPIVRKINQIGDFHGSELPVKGWGVLRANAKHHQATGVTDGCLEHLAIGLHDMLMRQDKPEPVFPSLSQHSGKNRCREGMELVDVQEKRSAFMFRNGVPGERLRAAASDPKANPELAKARKSP